MLKSNVHDASGCCILGILATFALGQLRLLDLRQASFCHFCLLTRSGPRQGVEAHGG